LDGRYRSAVAPLIDHLSEAALNRARVQVEVEWLIHLTDTGAVPGAPILSDADKDYLRAVVTSFGADEIAELAEIERETLHDVKAVEYFLRRRLDAAPAVLGEGTALSAPGVAELVHIFCTSEDVNNLSYALLVRGAVTEVWLPAARSVVDVLASLAGEHADAAMLARTHGQPATPTTLGKELAVLARRLRCQLERVAAAEYLGKLNGATGTYGAHVVSVPGTDWQEVSRTFVEHLGLSWNPLTTQIESHDWQAELYADVARFNRVLHNLATDVWSYISLGYFRQRLSAQGSTGSSTMPHKVNPIRFENAEANLEISCALFDTLASTLVTSRLQRDLTDSTTQRNIGSAFGQSRSEEHTSELQSREKLVCTLPPPPRAPPLPSAALFRSPGSTGAPTMPHKVNPIRFENAEANLEISCALFDTLASTLVTSRLQRDLTDSTTQRNIGSAFGHS